MRKRSESDYDKLNEETQELSTQLEELLITQNNVVTRLRELKAEQTAWNLIQMRFSFSPTSLRPDQRSTDSIGNSPRRQGMNRIRIQYF